MRKCFKNFVVAAIALTMICCAVLALYASDFYRSDVTAIAATAGSETVSVEVTDDMIIFRPENIDAGFIFYPGGKVEYTAYAPLMHALAQNSVACIITHMPFNLAVLDTDAAEKAYEKISGVDSWYIGGHSLGGSMAASFAADSDIDFEGIILLASYSTADLSSADLKALSVYGTEDGVLNMEKYRENYSNLPQNTTEVILFGGNHAQFGSYGVQEGDGAAEITAEQQIEHTATVIMDFIQ